MQISLRKTGCVMVGAPWLSHTNIMRLTPIIACIFFLMLPVTGMVPVLRELTAGRYPELSTFGQHLFMSANMVGALLFAPLSGLLSDLWQRRKPIILLALAINALALWMLQQDVSYPVYLAWRFVEGCAHISALSLLMTLAADRIRATHASGSIMGLVGAAISLGVACGAPLGGLLGRHGGGELVLQAGSLLLLTLLPLALLGLRDTGHLPSRGGLEGLMRALPENRGLLLPYAFAFVDRLTVGFIVSTLSLYLATVMGMDAGRIGLTMALFLLPFALLTWPAGLLSRRWNPLKMMFAGSIAYGLTLAAIGYTSGPQIPWLMFAGGIMASLMYAPSLILVADRSHTGHKALAMSGFNFAGSLGFVLGPLSGGALVDFFGSFPPAFLIIGSLEVLCVALFLPHLFRQQAKSY